MNRLSASFRFRCLLTVLLGFVFVSAAPVAKAAPAIAPSETNAVAAPAAPAPSVVPAGYTAFDPLPANIAPTTGAITGKVSVTGQPRTTIGHPSLMWDKEDIAHYQEMLKTSPQLQDELTKLKAWGDKRLTEPVGVPVPQQGPDGKWLFLGFVDPYKKEGDKWGYAILGATTQHRGDDIVNLATLYALTGDAKYGELCKKILLAYGFGYPRYGVPPDVSNKADLRDGLAVQGLDQAMFLMKAANGYDLIYNLPSITPDERKQIENDFLKGVANHLQGNKYLFINPTNWSAICTCSVFMAGMATDDQALINVGLYGQGGTKENPTGGLLKVHFGPDSIDEDGLWVEGAMGYQFMALGALIDTAEIEWHHGVDLYSYRDGALKRLFDSPMQFAYPDLTTPAFHDSHLGSLLDEYEVNTYEYAYRRYQDPHYLAILDKTKKTISMTVHSGPASVLYDLPTHDAASLPPVGSVNFFNVGYGMLRLPGDVGPNMLSLEYGPAPGHGHPDKLTVDLYAFNTPLMPDPGSVFPYGLPLYRGWYRTTVAHCTLTVDEQNQTMCGAHQIVFEPGSLSGIQRAWTADAYKDVAMDRSVFLTPHYYADLFGAFGTGPHKMDLAWHIRGQFSSDLTFSPFQFPAGMDPTTGYPALTNVQHTASPTDKPWTATLTLDNHAARLLAAGGTPTEIIEGNGHYMMKDKDDEPPAILERRETASTLYGNVADLSSNGYVKSVAQEGGLDAGYGLLKVATAKGADLCFTSFRPGSYKAGGLETDALQALVLMNGQNPESLYLGGGKTLAAGVASITRSEPGLAFVEKAADGGFIVGNPSPGDTTVTVTLPGLVGSSAFSIDANGQHGASVPTSKGASANSVVIHLTGASKVELMPKKS